MGLLDNDLLFKLIAINDLELFFGINYQVNGGFDSYFSQMALTIKYNSPVVLTISLICAVIYVADVVLNGTVSHLTALSPYLSPSFAYTSITHALTHGSASHLVGNLTLFLMIAPGVEYRFGWKMYLGMTVLCSVLTAVFHVMFYDDAGLIGLSGIVFMNIILASFTNTKRGEIPLTFVLVFMIYIGEEIWNTFKVDNISQFAHIVGGIIGGAFGIAGGSMVNTQGFNPLDD